MRATPQAVIDLVKRKEACVLHVYDDARPGAKEVTPGDIIKGVLTTGYGHTGHDVVAGMTVTQQMADDWLKADLSNACLKLYEKLGDDVVNELTDNQYAALIDFVYNLGTGSPKNPEWTIWKRLKAKQFDQVPLEMAKFVNDKRPDGTVVKLNGLVSRRNAEIALWAIDEPGTSDITPPSSATRMSITPPTAAEPTPPSKSTTIISGAVASIATVPVAVKQVSDAISPYADKSPAVANIVAILATIAALCVGLTVLFAYLHNRKARN